MPKSPKSTKRDVLITKKLRRNLFLIPLTAFAVKIFIILRIQGYDWYGSSGGDITAGLRTLLDNRYVPPNAWYGADGENYLEGLYGLAKSGFLSDVNNLSYWPAGYPLLMWPILEVTRGYFFTAIAILQSALYFAGTSWLVDELRRTRVSKASYLIAAFLALNPTLSLNTISIGYELPVVSLSLISTAAIVRFWMGNRTSVFSWEVFVASFAFATSVLMQPRLIILALVFFIVWAFSSYRARVIPLFLAFSMGIVSVAPAVMIYRNQQVHGYSAISTNLGVTMRLGAGPSATGGYSSKSDGNVQCESVDGDAAAQDAAIVRCVIHWYLENPVTSLKLFWNKARFFWSPWFGPEANGTMARNPWSQNHPFRSSLQTESGFNLIFGGIGKVVSWLWMLGGLALLFFGFGFLWRMGGLERALALLAGSTFILNLISSMLTIGDHRFRIPSMGMSLFLQAVGLFKVIHGKRSSFPSTTSLVSWPTFSNQKRSD